MRFGRDTYGSMKGMMACVASRSASLSFSAWRMTARAKAFSGGFRDGGICLAASLLAAGAGCFSATFFSFSMVASTSLFSSGGPCAGSAEQACLNRTLMIYLGPMESE